MAKKQIGEIDYNVEFNDSVLSTKTWSNPRYDGCETKTQELNKFTNGDITYGKKPAVQKYSRNIYVGKKILGYLDDLYLDLAHTQPNTGSFNTGKYTGFPDWSFVILEKFYTVNEDDSLEQSQKFEVAATESADPLGREFKSDFIAGTKCNIIDYSDTPSNLDVNYTINYNKGLLGKIAEGLGSRVDYKLAATTAEYQDVQSTGKFFMNILIDTYGSGSPSESGAFFIQPSSSFNSFWTEISGSGFQSPISGAFSSSQFFSALQERQLEYNDKYVIRFFSTSSVESTYVLNEFGLESRLAFQLNNIRSFTGGFIGSNGIIADIDTGKVVPRTSSIDYPVVGYDSFVSLTLDNNTNFVLYHLNESNNVIMVDLPRKRDLPNGIDKFIVLPENIHPYIKNNIDYFVNQIGLVNTNESFTINPQNRQLS